MGILGICQERPLLTHRQDPSRCFSMGSFVAASVYLCFTLLYGRRMRAVKEGVEEEGNKEASANEKEEENTESEEAEKEDEEEKEEGKEIGVTISDKVNTSVEDVGGEGS